MNITGAYRKFAGDYDTLFKIQELVGISLNDEVAGYTDRYQSPREEGGGFETQQATGQVPAAEASGGGGILRGMEGKGLCGGDMGST